MSTKWKIGVAGATGYVGGELLRTLLAHPGVEIGALTASESSAGSTLGTHHPHLVPLVGTVIQETTPEAFADHDVVFLALPHGTSAALAEALDSLDSEVLLIDCGADFRLVDSDDWATFYGGEHAGAWPYGLPELPGQREILAGTSLIAVPGCFPTVSTLTIMPALVAGLIDPDLTVVAPTGTSGAGKGLKPHLLGSEVMGNTSAYGVGGVHRHTPEIEQNLHAATGVRPTVSFTPILAPMSRGILATVVAPLHDGVTEIDIRNAYETQYADEPFVWFLPEGTWPQTQATIGANVVHVQATADTRASKLVAIGAMDNLAKGTAGGAIQSMNVALGLPEATGLTTVGVAP